MTNTILNPQFVAPNIEAIVLDFDNTIVECIEPKVAQHLDTARQLGIIMSEQQIRQNWSKHSFSGLLDKLYGSQVRQAEKLIIEQYDNFPKIIYPDTIETLQCLGSAGIRLAIVTSLREDRLEKDFEVTGIDPALFDYIQTEKATEVHKPNGAVFDPTKRWLRSVGVQDPTNALYIGDALEDMKAASEAGFSFLGIDRGFVTRPQFEAVGAFCISSLSELILRK